MMGLEKFGKISPPTYWEGKYALTIRDLYTRFTYCTILNYMIDFLPALKRFIAYSENHHNLRIGEMHKSCAKRPAIRIGHMRMDRHRSHVDKDVTNYLKDRGTKPEFVGPGASSHYQAGSLETVMYPNARRVIACMQHANAPKMMWGDAWLHIVNVISNLTKRPGDSQTHYELWNYAIKNELRSFVDGLRILFCLCFPHFSAETRKKLDVRSGRGIYLGKAEGFKAYRILLIETGNIVAAAEATFNESIMPFHYPEVWRMLGFSKFVLSTKL
jgi:hypothetical protein